LSPNFAGLAVTARRERRSFFFKLSFSAI
jgi:hypothetical protein